MKIEIPPIGRDWFAKPIHTAIAIAAGVLCLWIIADIGGSLFGSGEGDKSALKHLADMIVFAGVAFGVVGLVLYIMRFTVLQAIFLPWWDEMRDMAKAWREGQKPTQAEATMALGWAIATAATILGALIAIALVATPL